MFLNNSLKQVIMLLFGMKTHEDIITATYVLLFRR